MAKAGVVFVAGSMAAVLALFDVLGVIPKGLGYVADDFEGYLAAAQRFVDTGSPYAAVQLEGPYPPWELPTTALYLHPPTSLVLVVPFLVLPAIVWWAVPIGVIGWFLARCRPAPWGWAVIAMLVAWPRTLGAVMLGNSDLWVTAGIAAGFVYGWPAVLVFLKPTLAPFALVGVRHRSFWVGMAVFAVVSLAFWPLWWEWLTAVRNGQGLGLAYSLPNLAMPLIPVVAWVTRARNPTPGP